MSTSSQQVDGENGRASNAIDCRPTTYWHTAYTPSIEPFPHDLTADLGHPATVSGYSYLPRQIIGANGTLGRYEVQVSMDGETFTTVHSGTFSGIARQDVTFDPVEARFVRLHALSAANGLQYASAAEVDAIGEYVRVPLPDTLVTDDRPGTGQDTYTIPSLPNVQFLVNGNLRAPGVHTVPEGTTLVLVTAVPLNDYLFEEGANAEWRLTFSTDGVVSPSPTPPTSPKPTPTKPATPPTPTKSPSVKPTTTPPASDRYVRTVPYTKPGTHTFNGRQWMTTCEPYSQTERCRTDIWATVVKVANGAFVRESGWAFNNLTYLPYMTRQAWKGNPLGDLGSTTNGVFTSGGRQWKTECDTAATGRGACRSYTWTTVYAATAKPAGGYTFSQSNQWVFNNIVMFGGPEKR